MLFFSRHLSVRALGLTERGGWASRSSRMKGNRWGRAFSLRHKSWCNSKLQSWLFAHAWSSKTLYIHHSWEQGKPELMATISDIQNYWQRTFVFSNCFDAIWFKYSIDHVVKVVGSAKKTPCTVYHKCFIEAGPGRGLVFKPLGSFVLRCVKQRARRGSNDEAPRIMK